MWTSDRGLLPGTSTVHFGGLILKGFTGTQAGLNGMSISALLALDEIALGGGSTAFSIADIDVVSGQMSGAFTTGAVTQFAQDHLEAPACVPPPANLVSWWPANGNPVDLTGGNAGVLRNGAAFAAGEVQKGFSLNGSNQDILIGDPQNLKISPSITIDAWINPNAAPPSQSFRAILTKWGQGSPANYGLWLQNNGSGGITVLTELVDTAGSFHALSGGLIPLNSFSHVAVTYEGTTGVEALYVNGIQVKSGTGPAVPLATTDANVLIGSEADDGTGRYFYGVIDEVEIFNRSLGASEILAIYNAVSAGKCLPVIYAATGLSNVAGNLYTVDPSTAAFTLVGPITNAAGGGAIGITGLDFNPLTGMLYGITASLTGAQGNTVSKSLVIIDPTTAVAIVIGDLGKANSDISFRSDGTLFGFQSNDTAGTTHSMTKIDLGTGLSSVLGSSGLASTSGGGLAFDAAGTLYLSATGSSGTLDALNPANGTRTVGGSITGAPITGSINAMAANGETLFGADSNGTITHNSEHLVAVSRSAAAATVTDIGVLPDYTEAIAFAPASTPNGGLRITSITRSGSNIVVTFQAIQGLQYRLERKAAMTDSTWNSISGVNDLTAGSSGSALITDPGAVSLGKAFYRVRWIQ